MNNKPERILYFDIIRIVAIFLVVVNHVAAVAVLDPAHSSPENFGWWGAAFWEAIVSPAVALFVMVSGALFLSKPELSIKTLYSKYILRLFIIYAVWVIIYSLFFSANWEIRSLSDFISAVTVGGCGHLWYLPMLMIGYACLPILRKISADQKLLKYALILFASLLAYNYIATALGYIPWHQTELTSLTQRIPLIAIAQTSLIYCGYALLGFYLYQSNHENKSYTKLYICALLCLLITLGLGGILTSELGTFTYLAGGKYLVTMLMAAAIFLIIKKSKLSSISAGSRPAKLLSVLSACTLGIYLVHMLVLQKLVYSAPFSALYESLFNRYSWAVIPLLAMIILLISLGITLLLRKVPIVKKIVE